MKKILFIGLLLLAAATARAQHRESENIIQKLMWDDDMLNIMLDMRYDAQGVSANYDRSEAGFVAQTMKLWVVGEIVPGVRYRVRQRLNHDQAPLRDRLSGATDQAWVAFDFGRSKQWTVTAGKQSVQFGTFEYDYNPADIYLGTMAFNDLDAYKTGVNVAYRFVGQALNLQVFDSDAPQFATDDHADKALAAALLWEGDLFNGALRTRWGWGGFQHTSKKMYNWLTGGIQVNAGDFTTELDYYYGDRMMDYTSVIPDPALVPEARPVRDRSAAVNLKYRLGKWHPFVKGVWNRREDRTFHGRAYTNFGLQAVVEWYPFTDKYLKDLRFHAAWMYDDTAFKGPYAALHNARANTFLVGMRWLFKAK